MSTEGVVEAKLRHTVECLNEYEAAIKEGEYEEAFEAADAIGSEDGEGCALCEQLSSSLSASVAFAMWFPDEGQREEIASEAARHAARYAASIEAEMADDPQGPPRGVPQE